jgi:hypothetical protein
MGVNDSRWFAAWVVVGCALALATISFAVGPLLALPVVVIAVLMARNASARRSAGGGLVGIGLLLLFIAYVNRDGVNWSPLPWLFAGLAFVVGGFVAHRLRYR